MRIHKKTGIQVLDCGCERCILCEGCGGKFEPDQYGMRQFINCDNCKGDPHIKFCRVHAIKEGWDLDSGRRRR